MKFRKILVGALATVMLMGTLTMTTSAHHGRIYTAPKGTPTIDGDYDDVWATAPWTNVHNSADGKDDSTSRLRIKLLWDDNNLYFYGEVFDEHKNKRNDLIEIYVDQKNDKTVEYNDDDSQTRFYVHQLGAMQGSDKYAGENSQQDATTAIKTIEKDRYVVEGALVFNSVKPAVGNKMGLEFMYNDGNLYSGFVEAYRWNVDSANGENAACYDTNNWGTLVFADTGEALPENTYIEGEKMELTGKKDDADKDADASADADADTDADVDADKDTDKDADKGGMNKKTIIVIAVLAVAVVAFLVILLTGKKKKEDTIEEQK